MSSSVVRRVFRGHPNISIGCVMLCLILGGTAAVGWARAADPIRQAIIDSFQAPSMTHPFGTDQYGRDVFARTSYGLRVSLVVGVSGVLIGTLTGGILGVIAGFRLGRIDQIIMRVTDGLMSFPLLILGLMVMAALGSGMSKLVVAIAVSTMPRFIRIARAQTLIVREKEYIQACRALGQSDGRIVGRHVLPNVVGPVVVMCSLWTATAIRIEASLSFIGLSVRPPTPSLGGMVREGFDRLADAPWLAVFPGLALLFMVFAFNLIGDGLRDWTDPRVRRG
ncbi:MAG TPA: ABC transporter permease [Candidatus Acidoferrum sp.]|nr:ABC transporter permease [Candidatus Acidoferrum sp.]